MSVRREYKTYASDGGAKNHGKLCAMLAGNDGDERGDDHSHGDVEAADEGKVSGRGIGKDIVREIIS